MSMSSMVTHAHRSSASEHASHYGWGTDARMFLEHDRYYCSVVGCSEKLWFGHGCSSDRMLLEHERHNGLGSCCGDRMLLERGYVGWGTDAVMFVCSRILKMWDSAGAWVHLSKNKTPVARQLFIVFGAFLLSVCRTYVACLCACLLVSVFVSLVYLLGLFVCLFVCLFACVLVPRYGLTQPSQVQRRCCRL